MKVILLSSVLILSTSCGLQLSEKDYAAGSQSKVVGPSENEAEAKNSSEDGLKKEVSKSVIQEKESIVSEEPKKISSCSQILDAKDTEKFSFSKVETGASSFSSELNLLNCYFPYVVTSDETGSTINDYSFSIERWSGSQEKTTRENFAKDDNPVGLESYSREYKDQMVLYVRIAENIWIIFGGENIRGFSKTITMDRLRSFGKMIYENGKKFNFQFEKSE